MDSLKQYYCIALWLCCSNVKCINIYSIATAVNIYLACIDMPKMYFYIAIVGRVRMIQSKLHKINPAKLVISGGTFRIRTSTHIKDNDIKEHIGASICWSSVDT